MRWGNGPRIGDWVKTTDVTAVSMTDHLSGSGLAPGTKGVMTARIGSSAEVRFDSGFGTFTAKVPVRRLRVIRRGGGVDRFEERATAWMWVRVGLIAVMVGPLLWASIQYLWVEHTLEGLLVFLIDGTLSAVANLAIGALMNPGKAVLFFAVSALLSRLAFGRH
jgi:hypothetical protein